MEDEQIYQPETAESAPEATTEGTGEQVVNESETGDVESATPAPEEKTVPLKAVQEERRKRQELAKESEYWRKVALGEIENPVTKATPLEKPKPDQFNDYDDYVEALADWKIEQREQTNKKLTREQIALREEHNIKSKAAQDAQKASEKYPDFYDVAKNVNLPEASLKALYQSDLGPEIAYYLGKNEAELDRISELSPSRQIMELGKLEVKLASKTANPETKRNKQPTQVESSGNGFKQQKVNLSDIRAEAIRTGRWEKYIEAAGIVPT